MICKKICMEILIAEKNITTEASPERVWDLLGTLIFDSLSGLEKMEIIDENNFRAELKAKAFGLPLVFSLRGEMIDISPPNSLTVKLSSKWSRITVVQRIAFRVQPGANGGATMVCRAVAEDLSPIVRWTLLGQVKNMAGQIFDAMERGLKQLA